MTERLEEQRILCPYCWEPITVLIDPGDMGVTYVEDCQVCCRPMVLEIRVGADASLLAEVRREDE